MELLKNVSMEKLNDMIANNAAAIEKLQASTAVTETMVRDLTNNVNRICLEHGNINNRPGKVMELVVVPGIRPILSDAGRHFDEVIPNVQVATPRRKITQIDVFLDNGKESMAVEIKTRLTVDEVNEHLERLKKLREHEALVEIQEKTLYGGIWKICA